MKINIKIIDSNFNKETGVSTTTILTELGSFIGIAKLHPDDQNQASRYAGCRYAEIRATIKYIKMKKKVFKEEIKLLNKIYNSIINKKSKEKIAKEKENVFNNIQECNKHIDTLKQVLITSINEREKIINKKH